MTRPVVSALAAALFALAISSADAAPPGRMDASKRADQLGKKEAVLPGPVPIEKNNRIGDQRFQSKTSPRGEERSVIGDKKVETKLNDRIGGQRFTAPDRPEDPRVDKKSSVLQDRKAGWSPSNNPYPSRTALRFQEKLGEAKTVFNQRSAQGDKKATFDKVNRFAFRKNGDQAVTTIQAGSSQPGTDISGQSTASGAR